MSLPIPKLEVELGISGAGFTDITADLIGSINWGRGNTNNNPLSVCAQPGQLTFQLKNSKINSGGTIGYYSPFNSSRRAGWRIGIKVKLTWTWSGTRTEFVGWITRIDVAPGLQGPRTVSVTAEDWIGVAGRYTIVSAMPTLVDTYHAAIFKALIASVPTQYLYERFAYDEQLLYGLPFALDTIRQDKPNLMSELQKLALSSLGRIYVLGDGTVCYGINIAIPGVKTDNSVSIGTLSDSDITAISIPSDRTVLVNRIRISVGPRTDDTSNVVLFTDAATPQIGPGGALTIRCQFTDPNQKAARVGCKSLVNPVATTDYLFNTNADGSGTNITSSFTVTAVANGADALVTITNNHATLSGYRTLFKLRGKGLYTYAPHKAEIFDADSEAAFGSTAITIEMPYMDVASSFLVLGDSGSVIRPNSGGIRAMLRRYMSPLPASPSVTFVADNSTKLDLFFRDLALISTYSTGFLDATHYYALPTKATVSESVTGINAEFFIHGMKKSYNVETGALSCTWNLDPAEPITPWVVGTSALGIDDTLS